MTTIGNQVGRRVLAFGLVLSALAGIAACSVWLWRGSFWPALGMTGAFLAECCAIGLLRLLGLLLRRRHEPVLVLQCRRFAEAAAYAGARNRWVWQLIAQASRDTFRGARAAG